MNFDIEQQLTNIQPERLNIIVLLIGVVCVLVGCLLDSNKAPSAILTGIGASVIASAVVAYLTSHYLKSNASSNQVLMEWGLSNIFRTRAESNQLINSELPKTKKLDILAFGLRSFRDAQGELIRNRIKEGLEVRILTMDPNSSHLSDRNQVENLTAGQLSQEIIELAGWCDGLNRLSEKKGRIEIRFYSAPIHEFIFRTDEVLLAGPYLNGKTSQQTITSSFSKGRVGYEYWQAYFEELWEGTTSSDNQFPLPEKLA